MTTKEIRDKVEDVYIKETGRFAFLDENKLDDRYVEWLENQVMNNFVLDPVSYCGLTEGEQEERRDLMALRADHTRFFHQSELDRLNEINDKMFKN